MHTTTIPSCLTTLCTLNRKTHKTTPPTSPLLYYKYRLNNQPDKNHMQPIDIIAIVLSAIVIPFNLTLIYIIRRYRKEEIIFIELCKAAMYNDNRDRSIHQETRKWTRKPIPLKRKKLLIQAGIQPEQAYKRQTMKLNKTQLKTLAALQQQALDFKQNF